MPRFFFPVDYDGTTYGDDRGEVFSSSQEAANHAAVVANELGRNNSKGVTVYLVGDDRTLLGLVRYKGSESPAYQK
jgi:hypothetical protein